MRKPFQRLRFVFGVSAACISGLMAFPALAQQSPVGPVLPVEPTRPPDCLDCPAPSTSPRAVITNPTWARRPMPEYPERAMAAGILRGRVTVTCSVKPDGTLSGCDVVEETPAGSGFGQSALNAAAMGRLSLGSVDPAGAAGRVSFTINYLLPEPEPVAPPLRPRR